MKHSHLHSSARFASQVKRYHTWPTIQSQTIADHSYGMLLIWMKIWGLVPENVTGHIVKHDLGEIVSGDPPFPSKANNPAFKEAHDLVEADALHKLGLPSTVLTAQDLVRVKVCDLLEMLEFGLTEVLLGNSLAEPIVTATLEKVLVTGYQPDDAIAIKKYLIDHVYERPEYAKVRELLVDAGIATIHKHLKWA